MSIGEPLVDFGKELEKAIVAYIAPFLCCVPDADGKLNARNGTAFFVAAARTFVVTADHVLRCFLSYGEQFGKRVRCQLGNFDLSQRNG